MLTDVNDICGAIYDAAHPDANIILSLTIANENVVGVMGGCGQSTSAQRNSDPGREISHRESSGAGYHLATTSWEATIFSRSGWSSWGRQINST